MIGNIKVGGNVGRRKKYFEFYLKEVIFSSCSLSAPARF